MPCHIAFPRAPLLRVLLRREAENVPAELRETRFKIVQKIFFQRKRLPLSRPQPPKRLHERGIMHAGRAVDDGVVVIEYQTLIAHEFLLWNSFCFQYTTFGFFRLEMFSLDGQSRAAYNGDVPGDFLSNIGTEDTYGESQAFYASLHSPL